MQKLGERKTYTPRNTSLVPCSVTHSLNREETFSEMSLKTSSNNPEVNLRQHTGGLKDKVYVKSVDGQVLMPCSNTKARHLLESGKAKVVRKYPSKDIFWVNGIKYIAKGMFNYGKYILYGDV